MAGSTESAPRTRRGISPLHCAASIEYLQLDGEDHEYRRPIRGKILISRMVSFLTGALKVS
jgi:hypothetical protein